MSGLYSEADLSVDNSINGATTGPFSVFNAGTTALLPSASSSAAASAAVSDPTAALFDALCSSLSASPHGSDHFPSSLAATPGGSGCTLSELQRQEVIRGLNALWRERAQALRDNQTSQEELSILRSKLDDATDRCSTLKLEKSKAERQAWEVEERRRLEHGEAIKAEKNMRKAMAEMEKANNMLRGCETQYKHQLRKGELAFTTIQEKLHKIILEKTSAIPTTSSLGSTHSTKQLAAASAANAAAGSWQMSAPVKSTIARKTAANDLPTSSADVELLQSTLTTYSDRMNELVGENIALKAALKNLAGELEGALKEHAAPGLPVAVAANEDSAPAASIEDEYASSTVETDENGVPLPLARKPRCISPSTQALLADFTPSQIELPWDLVGQSIQKVLSAKLMQLRQGVAHSRAAQAAAADAEFESTLVSTLKAKIAEQSEIIKGQDGIIQQVLAAPLIEEEVARESQEIRRLSMRAEIQDWNARRAAISAGAAAALQQRAGVPPSPSTARILGPHTAANLPVFPTPAKPSFASLAAITAPSATVANPKSKWLAGGVLASPVFTPSKRSGLRGSDMRAEDHDSANLSSTQLDELDEEEIEAAFDFANDDEEQEANKDRLQEERPAEEQRTVAAVAPMSLQAAAAARIK